MKKISPNYQIEQNTFNEASCTNNTHWEKGIL